MMAAPASSSVRFAGYRPLPVGDGLEVACVRLFETSAWMLYRRDIAEHQRRQRRSLGALDDMGLLDMLMDLPSGLPVDVQSLHEAERRRIRGLPQGVVECSQASVVRLAVPPVSPVLVMVTSTDWDRGLERASRFASYCPRMLVTRRLPPTADVALSEASWYGIGVVAGEPGALETYVEAEPLEDWQPTPAWWQFCERVYGQLPYTADGGQDVSG